MLPVNDDMDELFRKAAENYPLKTDSDDWSEVNKKLLTADFITVDKAVVKKRDHKYLLLLLLLIPATWLGYNYFTTQSKNLSKNIVAKNFDESKVIPKQKGGEQNKNAQGSIQHNKSPAAKHTAVKATETQNDNSPGNKKRCFVAKAKKLIAINNASIADIQNSEQLKNYEQHKKEIVIDDDKKITASAQEHSNKVNDDKDEKKISIIESSKSLKNEKKTKNNKDHWLYAGVIAGPDVSTIKFQSVNNVGISFGLVVGYHFNKRLDIETGLLSDKKFYYSDGKYFNTGKINLPSYYKLINVSGYCRMLEVPLNVKYNFRASAKSNLFSSIGFSSYFMNKEKYDYTVVGSGQPYQRKSTYNESVAYWFSVMNMSFGYDHKLGNTTMLRIEPYIKFPLKGVGVGSLPIMSTGLHIGLTKKLF